MNLRNSPAVSLAVLLAAGVLPAATAAPRVSFLRADGVQIVNEKGVPVSLRGYNLGGWLLLEPWMVKLNNQPGIETEKDIWDTIERRFGPDKMRAAVATHRDNFINESDIETLHRLGVNFVRLPIWWRVLGDTHYDSNGWKYVDRLLDWCEKRGMYVLLDLHGAPGGQGKSGDILGERPGGEYWGADGKYRAQTIEWWRAVASRYAKRRVVAGYDLLNEANAAPSVQALVTHMDEIVRAIREVDSRHLIFIQDGLLGFYRLPRPADMGWTNVVYSFHFYPENGLNFVERALAGVRAAQSEYGVPLNIGEFNVFSIERGGLSLFERGLEVFNACGLSWNVWSYKVLEDNANYFWGIEGYTDQPLQRVSLSEGSYEEIVGYLRRTASRHWRESEAVRDCVTRQLKPVAAHVVARSGDELRLFPRDAILLPRSEKESIHVEWQWAEQNLGFWGSRDSAAWKVTTSSAGPVQLDLHYSAGTESPIARVFVDGVTAGNATLPPTGDWKRYQWASIPLGSVSAGDHIVRVACGGGTSFLNLREAKLKRVESASNTKAGNVIELTPAEIASFQRKRHLCVEWQMAPPNIGYWCEGETVVFRFHLPTGGTFAPSFDWASPNQRVGLRIETNDGTVETYDLAGTGGWRAYELRQPSRPLRLPAGPVELRVTPVDVNNAEGAGNLRWIRLLRIGK